MSGLRQDPIRHPDWHSLVASRERLAGQTSSGSEELDREWRQALDHREQCEPCRRSSNAADPLLVFQQLQPLEIGAGAVEEMQQRVRGALRVLQREPSGRHHESLSARGSKRGWGAGLAAAAVLMLLAWGIAWPPPAQESSTETVASELLDAESKRSVIAHLAQLPAVEAEAEMTLLLEGESFELVQLGALGH